MKAPNKNEAYGKFCDTCANTTKEWLEAAKTQLAALKTPEGRSAFMAKAQATSATAKDKIVTLWKSGRNGKAIIFVAALFLLWMVIPSCGNENEAAQRNHSPAKLASSGNVNANRADFQKIRDNDKLWFNGDTVTNESAGYTHTQAVPNLAKIPDFIRFKEYLYNAMEQHCKKEKGDAFEVDDPRHKVIFVGNGFVVVTSGLSGRHSINHAYIATSDKYVKGEMLRDGLYAYTGRETVPLANGSSETMLAFKQLDNGLHKKYVAAKKWNIDAEEAANEEDARRCNIAFAELEKQQEAESKNFSDNFNANVDDMFRKALASFDENAWRKRVHVSNALKGKIKVSEVSTWYWKGEDETPNITFAEFKKRLQEEGGAKYWADNEQLQSSKENVMRAINLLFKTKNYMLHVDGLDGKCNVACYKIERAFDGEWTVDSIDPSQDSDMEFALAEFQDPDTETTINFYLIDEAIDADIKSAYVNGDGEDGGISFMKAFGKKYGK